MTELYLNAGFEGNILVVTCAYIQMLEVWLHSLRLKKTRHTKA